MAQLSDNLSYIAIELEQAVARHRELAATRFEEMMVRQVTSGEGQGSYSTKPTWFNITRIPRFAPTLQAYAEMMAGRTARDEAGRFTSRSKFGKVSVFMQGGYREFRNVVGRQTSRVDYTLTGEFVNALVGRSRPTAGGMGMRLWLGFYKRQQRSYGNLTNAQLAEEITRRAEKIGGPDPFRADDVGAALADELMEVILRESGAR